MWLHDFCASDVYGWVSIYHISRWTQAYRRPRSFMPAFVWAFIARRQHRSSDGNQSRPVYYLVSCFSRLLLVQPRHEPPTIAYTMQSLISRFHRSMHASSCTLSRLNCVFRYLFLQFSEWKFKLMRHASITQHPLRHISPRLDPSPISSEVSMGSRAVIKSQSSIENSRVKIEFA